MPPKKKGKGKKKKGNEDSEIEVKFKQSQHEVDALKDQMAYRRELSRRSLAIADNYREQVQAAEENTKELQSDMKAVSSNLTQQYKTMQMELGLMITTLESKLKIETVKLNNTEHKLKQQIIDYKHMQEEKDNEIRKLNDKISKLETSFENLIDIGFDDILTRLFTEKKTMDTDMDKILAKNKSSLRDQNIIHLET